MIWGSHKIRGTIWGVPFVGILVFWDIYIYCFVVGNGGVALLWPYNRPVAQSFIPYCHLQGTLRPKDPHLERVILPRLPRDLLVVYVDSETLRCNDLGEDSFFHKAPGSSLTRLGR